MSENIENFETLLEESLKTLNTGDIVTGTVRAVGTTELQVDLPAKVTGIVPFDEITDDSSVKLSSLYKVGDEITAQAVRVSDVDGIATLSLRRIARITNWQKIKEGLESGEIFTGKVTEIVKGGVIVSCNFIKVFVPAGQTGVPKTGNLEEIKGKTVQFKIIEVNDERKSRRLPPSFFSSLGLANFFWVFTGFAGFSVCFSSFFFLGSRKNFTGPINSQSLKPASL